VLWITNPWFERWCLTLASAYNLSPAGVARMSLESENQFGRHKVRKSFCDGFPVAAARAQFMSALNQDRRNTFWGRLQATNRATALRISSPRTRSQEDILSLRRIFTISTCKSANVTGKTLTYYVFGKMIGRFALAAHPKRLRGYVMISFGVNPVAGLIRMMRGRYWPDSERPDGMRPGFDVASDQRQ